MPAERSASTSSAPPAARPLLFAAAWTGAGTAVVAAIVASVAVAICWLPAAGRSANAGSAMRAGVLTFLAGLHGGITVDRLTSAFVPLGLTALIGVLAWRAGCALAGTAADLDADDVPLLIRAAVLQTMAFAFACAVGAAAAGLGTSHVRVARAAIAALILFAGTGGVAFVRRSALGDAIADRAPDWLNPAARAAGAAIAVYIGAGALLVAGSLVAHHGAVETLSRQVGGGWSGAPVLLLGILAAPNAAIAGASYLAGPGFALGHGSGVSLGSTVHGTVPAFPVLGAVPAGPATTPVWLLTAAAPVLAGMWFARIVAAAAATWREQLRVAAAATAATVGGGLVLGWQGGGAIGSGRLSALGASPWQFGLATGAGAAAVAAATLGGLGVIGWWRNRGAEGIGPTLRAGLVAVSSVVGHRDYAVDEPVGEPDAVDEADAAGAGTLDQVS